MRSLRTLVAVSALLVLAPGVAGASECQALFERWSKLSQARVRLQNWVASGGQPATGDKRPPSQACAPGEATRQELLRGLARVRSRCDESPSDPLAPATKTMVDINEGFIRSLPLCRTEAAAVGAPKAAPAPPPAAVTAAAPAAAAVPPEAAAPPPPPAPEHPEGAPGHCLQVSRISRERYKLSNRWCGGNTVLAIVETHGASGEVECRAHAIGQSMTVRSLNNMPPQVNLECIWSQANCTKDHLDGMFPECDW